MKFNKATDNNDSEKETAYKLKFNNKVRLDSLALLCYISIKQAPTYSFQKIRFIKIEGVRK